MIDLTNTVPACIRCTRPEHEHQLHDRGEADEIQVRIWRALGHPCAGFTLTPAGVFAGQQSLTSRWASRVPRVYVPERPPAPTSSNTGATRTGAAIAHELLDRALGRAGEAS